MQKGPPTVSRQEALAFIATGAIWAGIGLLIPLGFLNVFCLVPHIAFLYWGLRVWFYADHALLKAIAVFVEFGLVITLLPAFFATMLVLQGL